MNPVLQISRTPPSFRPRAILQRTANRFLAGTRATGDERRGAAPELTTPIARSSSAASASQRTMDRVNQPSHKSQIVGRVARATRRSCPPGHRRRKVGISQFGGILPPKLAPHLLDRVAAILRRDRILAGRTGDRRMRKTLARCRRRYRRGNRFLPLLRLADAPALRVRTATTSPARQNTGSTTPRGVAVVIAPWNFPLAILCGMAAAAFVAGNPVILKPAEQSPLIAAALDAAFEEAGAPAGVVNYLPGDRRRDRPDSDNPSRRRHDRLHRLASRRTGHQRTRQHDADGQDSHQARHHRDGRKKRHHHRRRRRPRRRRQRHRRQRFRLHRPKMLRLFARDRADHIHDALLDRLIEATRSLKIAPAEDPACRVGPVIDADAFAASLPPSSKAKPKPKSSTPAMSANSPMNGYFIAPHIFANVPPTSRLATEEIFGPVLSVMKATDLGRRPDHRQRRPIRPHRRRLFPKPGEHRPLPRANSVSAISTSTAALPELWSAASPLAALSSLAAAPRPAARIISAIFSSPAASPKTPSATALSPQIDIRWLYRASFCTGRPD